MDDAESPPGWTNLHIHPVAADWRPDPGQLTDLLQHLGVERLLVVGLRAHPDDWQAEVDNDPFVEEEDVDLLRFVDLLGHPRAVHLSALLDPAACGLAETCVALDRGSKGDWQACVVSLGIGPTSIPDIEGLQTAARFTCSLAIGGPGIPRNPARAALSVPRLAVVEDLVARLTSALGQRCVAHLDIAPE